MIELHTGRYAQAKTIAQRRRDLSVLKRSAQLATSLGLKVAAGHGLDYRNTSAVCQIQEIEELNIGYSIVVRSLEVGWAQAVRRMRSLMQGGRE